MQTAVDDVMKIVNRLEEASGQGAKHVQLQTAFKELIREGVWLPGEKLPTETELAACLPFSLGTIQRCLRGLVDEGIVLRKRGYGTYIPERLKELSNPWHMRFVSDDGNGFLPVYAFVLRRFLVDAPGRWTVPLAQRAEKVLRIDRRMQIGEEFSVYARFYALVDRVPKLHDVPVSELNGANIKKMIAADFNTELAKVHHFIQQTAIPRFGCSAIGVPAGTTATLVTCTAFFGAGPAVYYQEFFVPPNQRKLFIESKLGMGL